MAHKPYGPYERFVKRLLDCFLATCALIVLSPILGITALLVKKKLGSPVLFKQDRPGRDERIFQLNKFRSMTDERDANGELLPDDVRLTKFGRIYCSAKKYFNVIVKALMIYIVILCFYYSLFKSSSFKPIFSITLILAISISYFVQYYFGICNSLLLNADQKIYVGTIASIIILF